MKAVEMKKLISLLIRSVEGGSDFENVMQEISMFENIESNKVVEAACHELRHFYIDADLRASDHDYDVLMKKRLTYFVERIRSLEDAKP